MAVSRKIVSALIGAAVAACVAIPSDAASRRAPRPAATPVTTTPTAPVVQSAVSIVNDQIISEYDLNQRIALFLVSSGAQPTAENMSLIRAQVLRTLQDEILQVKEAADHGVTVSKEEIDQSLEAIAKDNNTSVAEIEAALARGGVAMATFRAQLLAQIAWNKAVQGRFGQRLEIREEDVTAAIDRVKQGATKPQFRVYEIFLTVDKPEDDAKVRTTAAQLIAQLNSGANFTAIARGFSQSPSAALGGDIGWVESGQLSDELDKALQTMRRGAVAGPIRSTGGYYILMLRARREPAGTPERTVTRGLPGGSISLARFLIVMPRTVRSEIRDRAMGFAVNLSKGAQSCADLQRVAANMRQGGIVYMSLGTISPSSLSEQVRGALAKTEPGGITEPFISSDGIELIARCEPRVDPIDVIVIPTPEQMRAQLFQQRAGILARSYLRDLRRDAVIENR